MCEHGFYTWTLRREDSLFSSCIERGSQGSVITRKSWQCDCVRCAPVSDMVMELRLRFFGHIACSAPNEDHRAVAVAVWFAPDWKQPQEDPVMHTWLRAIHSDLKPLNTSPSYAQKKASSWDCGNGYAQEEYTTRRERERRNTRLTAALWVSDQL